MSVRIFTTKALRTINQHSVKSGYNRTFSPSGVDALDPLGNHLVGFTMVHNDDHLRAQLLLKVTGNDEPVHAFLDMSFEDFDKHSHVIEVTP